LKRLQKTAALLIIVLLFVTMVPTAAATDNDNGVAFTEVNETVYAIAPVNVRTGPSIAFARISTLAYSEAVQRTGIGENGWSKVIYNGEIAYISSDYLSTTRPVIAQPNVDYAKLTRAVAIANGLKKLDYTTASWSVLSDALTQAINALNSNSQTVVDASNEALEAAITALVKADRSALEEALDAADHFVAGEEKTVLWFKLIEAVNNGKALLSSNDQTAIDAAAAQIDEILAEVKAIVEAQNTPEIVTQEVMVEVPPTDDYCNIPIHRVWPVLFFCSLALNVALVAVIVIYISRKKKNQKDDTPLVDYDISDDLF